jgi:hypothetical protein
LICQQRLQRQHDLENEQIRQDRQKQAGQLRVIKRQELEALEEQRRQQQEFYHQLYPKKQEKAEPMSEQEAEFCQFLSARWQTTIQEQEAQRRRNITALAHDMVHQYMRPPTSAGL